MSAPTEIAAGLLQLAEECLECNEHTPAPQLESLLRVAAAALRALADLGDKAAQANLAEAIREAAALLGIKHLPSPR